MRQDYSDDGSNYGQVKKPSFFGFMKANPLKVVAAATIFGGLLAATVLTAGGATPLLLIGTAVIAGLADVGYEKYKYDKVHKSGFRAQNYNQYPQQQGIQQSQNYGMGNYQGVGGQQQGFEQQVRELIGQIKQLQQQLQ